MSALPGPRDRAAHAPHPARHQYRYEPHHAGRKSRLLLGETVER
ncbi:hypothetical protein [Streptomyces longwoodensis]